jgi:hypothetical protein
MEEFTFPSFEYYVDESDPDVVILRRQDGSNVAAFSARGVTNEGIIEAATEDRRKSLCPSTIEYIVSERSGRHPHWRLASSEGRPLRGDFYQGRVTDTPDSKSPPGRLQRLTR